MVSGIRWFPGSGAFGNTIASLYTAGKSEPGAEIFTLEAGKRFSPNRLGFFGSAGAPNSAITVGQYQDRTHRVDDTGADLGQFNNVKFTGASIASVSGVPITSPEDLGDIPAESGTLLCRFKEPNDTAVVTQNAVFRCINLTAASGAPDVADNVSSSQLIMYAAQLADNAGNAGDTSWTRIDTGGSVSLSLANQSDLSSIHDFHLIVSLSPQIAGRKIDFGFYMELEFL